MGFRGVLGHEFVGEVVSSPDKDLVGQRVVGEINVVCGRCDLCLSGLAATAATARSWASSTTTARSPTSSACPRPTCTCCPKTVDDDAAVFVEPLAAAFQVLKQVQARRPNKWVTVLGDGRLGPARRAGPARTPAAPSA